ncbi:MAG: Minf_1886 family protein [Chthoniobacteraceae bacterium]
MQKTGFTEALEQAIAADPRYDKEAYLFLQDALDFTMKSRKKQKTELSRHVTGQELLEGVRQHALKEYGPMVTTVFEAWGIHRCDDFGEMVFNLIRVGIFGKTDSDTIDDFRNGYDFREAFVLPFLPDNRTTPPKETVQQS